MPKRRIATTYADLAGDERGSLSEFVVDGPSMERHAREHPELAYRRGYQQGSGHVLDVLEKAGALPPALLAVLNGYQTKVAAWRYPRGDRRRLRRHMRDDAAPELNLDRVKAFAARSVER
jgi:hypothetical protein